jgi:hypothetical protein
MVHRKGDVRVCRLPDARVSLILTALLPEPLNTTAVSVTFWVPEVGKVTTPLSVLTVAPDTPPESSQRIVKPRVSRLFAVEELTMPPLSFRYLSLVGTLVRRVRGVVVI